MEKKILVLQFRTDKTLMHERECITRASLLSHDSIKFLNVFGEEEFKIPTLEGFNGLIIAGSGEFNLTDLPERERSRIAKITPLIKNAVGNNFPTLGICFGHQLLAEIFDGHVERDESQREGGTVKVYLNEEGKNSALFRNIPEELFVSSGHKDSVTKLPYFAVTLASSVRTKFASYKLGNNVYSVQFHPELELDDIMYRFSLYPEYLNGKTLEEIRKEHDETPYAYKIVQNFINYVAN